MQSVVNLKNMNFRDFLALESFEIPYRNICDCSDCIFATNKMIECIQAELQQQKEDIQKSILAMEEAFNLALEVITDYAGQDEVGNYIGYDLCDEFVVNHYFECLRKGYRGWKWTATVACPLGQDVATVCEIDLLPSEDALLAPQWGSVPKQATQEFSSRQDELDEVPLRTQVKEKKKSETTAAQLVVDQGIFSEKWSK